MSSSFGLVQNVTISSYHLSRASTVEIFGCTLKSRINFNSADSSSSTLAFSKRTKASSNLLEEFWGRLLNAADLLEVAFAFYISLSPLKSSLKDLAKQISGEGRLTLSRYGFGFFALVLESLSNWQWGCFFLLFPYGSSLITLCSSCSNRYYASE